MFQLVIYDKEVNLENGKVIKYRLFAMGKYKTQLRDQILNFKFNGYKSLGHNFAVRIYEDVLDNPEVFPSPCLNVYDCMLPVPSTPSSLSKRGYDHLLLLGQNLSELCGLPLAKDILESLERDAQKGRSNTARVENVKGAFHLINPSRVEGKSFLVLDDISTSGATLDEMIRTLCKSDPRRVDALVLAKT